MTTVGSEPIAASPDAARRLEELQFVLGEGPTGEAFRAGRPVLMNDLGDTTTPWREFAAAAVDHDVGAAYAFPLQLGAVRLGVLTAYCATGRVLAPSQLVRCVDVAEQARNLLLDALDHDGENTTSSFSLTLPLRTEVYQAQGMLMEALSISLADALVRLRATAYAEGIDLNDLAADLVNGRRLMPVRADDA